ncbi:predicted protein [Sclerotinia sclerotiorum 1980 UF-70]|uniref:Uncharacterized protein n=2 Tax=Sclerotinia sclerotiorum (strain ATCC 18683 / 1980 / Ss-1) TaxID=665079 RepID=A7E843_SCLS1|nr:predicted protein [Sclerotinia sclerotiorum 1980 UF-70]APA06095.1 hypothetical protein sscle_01g008650 [Sclerotinia sclerotiorum 1980 UF-70]EDN96545.1 predicted protein [Sclerotinia sclerotiorum 1980 UF-70]
MHSQQSKTLLALLLSHVLTISASPALIPIKVRQELAPVPSNFNPGTLAVQPNNGGGTSDDCGSGPITLDRDTWNSRNVDQIINDMFSSRMSDPSFDFHQEFGNKYNVDFYCPNSFDNCETTPPSCSSLNGTVTEKEQGWLGIKAMMNVQQMYLQWEKVMSNSVDTLTQTSVDFQSNFAPTTPGAKVSAKNTVTVISGGLAIAAVIGTLWIPGAAAFTLPVLGTQITAGMLTVGAGVGAGVTTLAGTITNDVQDGQESDELSVLQISDLLPAMKQLALSGLEFSHNGTFSNGMVSGNSVGNMKDLLLGGAFSGSDILQAYVGGENGLDGLFSRYAAIQLLQAYWEAQNAFFIYIPDVTSNCQGWHGNTGGKDAGDPRRYCGEKGMMILAGVDNNSKFSAPQGIDNGKVASIGGFNIPLQSLYESTYNMYTGHGLDSYKDLPYHLNNIAQEYVGNNDANKAYTTAGFFTLPVCELKAEDWKQSDNMHKSPPCDCFCAQDAWGHKFIDYASQPIKTWLQGCPACS